MRESWEDRTGRLLVRPAFKSETTTQACLGPEQPKEEIGLNAVVVERQRLSSHELSGSASKE